MGRQKKSEPGPITPEKALTAKRALRRAFIVAAVQAWVVVGIVAWILPHRLALFVVLAVAYSIPMPFLLRHLYRGIDRRVLNGATSDSTERLARETGLSASSR